jgi:hypothetical protein
MAKSTVLSFALGAAGQASNYAEFLLERMNVAKS